MIVRFQQLTRWKVLKHLGTRIALTRGMHARRWMHTKIDKDVLSTFIFNAVVVLILFWVFLVSLDYFESF